MSSVPWADYIRALYEFEPEGKNMVHLSLSPEAIARLAEIATRCGETRSGVVERLVREAEMPRPRDEQYTKHIYNSKSTPRRTR